MRAWLNLRYTVPERRRVFAAGLKRLGYTIIDGLTQKPKDGDLLVTWNRIGPGQAAAREFESRGLPVIVTENASWGNDFAGCGWYTLSRTYHNQSGRFTIGDSSRWDSMEIQLAPWRRSGETVILPQRGIGPPGIRMPSGWQYKFKGRIRNHPGRRKDPIPLERDLSNAGRVITWGSGAAIKALMLGISVESHMPRWIGTQDNTDEGRLAMFRRLAWAQWRLSEIENGEPFKILLEYNGG